MSTKLATKSVKRASSTSKKKGAGGTPDTSTPTASGASIGVDKAQESTIDDVLTGNDVQSLRIREEDLTKIHPPKPPSSDRSRPPQTKRKVAVRKVQLLAGDELLNQKEREVAVLRPLPPGTTIAATRTIGSVEGGPRFDQRGMFVSHSVLGPTVDFATELKNNQMVGSTSVFSQPPPVALPDVKKATKSKRMSYEKTILPKEKHALKYWDESVGQRKSQQQNLSRKVGTSPERLTMNQGDGYRRVQEERMLIDRTMPTVNYGKGYRVGSEFWSQHVKVGDQSTGIHTTLTRTERGLPPELEFVGIPAVVEKERGVSRDLERNAPSHYTWDQSSYLSTRRMQLNSALMDMHRPEVSELHVIGHAPDSPHNDGPVQDTSGHRMRTDSLDSLGDYESVSSEGDELPGNILDLHADITPQPIIGPALLVNGQLLQWEGPPLPPTSNKPSNKPFSMPSKATQSESALNTVKPRGSTTSLRDYDPRKVSFLSNPINFRLTFESDTGAVTTTHLELENCGTAAVYYSWQPLPKSNPLGTVQAGDTQRFYFDTRGGVLLPGQKLAFPFVFKSPHAGIFSETWLLQTGPVLCRGRPVIFTLKGVAVQDDLNKHKRDELERELKHRMAVAAAQRLINRLVDSIRTPPHSPEPIKIIETEEHKFKAQNPAFYYHHGVVQQLKILYDSVLRPERVLQDQLLHEPSTRSEKSGAGKKGDDKAGSGGSKGREKATGKDKKATKVKDDVLKEEVASQNQEEEPKSQVPDWDLSIASLQEVILGVDDVAVVESKLKELSALVSALSFPPHKQIKRNHYNIVYEALCEAVDLMSDMSSSLCHTMGLPAREFTRAKEETGSGNGDKLTETDETKTPSQPSSPAHMSKDKKGAKDAKKTKAGKDSLKTGSSKNKTVPTKKSKSTLSPKDSDTIKEVSSGGVTAIVVDVDPVLKKKYRDNFHSSVYEILGSTADRIAMLLEEMSLT